MAARKDRVTCSAARCRQGPFRHCSAGWRPAAKPYAGSSSAQPRRCKRRREPGVARSCGADGIVPRQPRRNTPEAWQTNMAVRSAKGGAAGKAFSARPRPLRALRCGGACRRAGARDHRDIGGPFVYRRPLPLRFLARCAPPRAGFRLRGRSHACRSRRCPASSLPAEARMEIHLRPSISGATLTLHWRGSKRGARISTVPNDDRSRRGRRFFSGHCPPHRGQHRRALQCSSVCA
jgi:hypothetical protein